MKMWTHSTVSCGRVSRALEGALDGTHNGILGDGVSLDDLAVAHVVLVGHGRGEKQRGEEEREGPRPWSSGASHGRGSRGRGVGELRDSRGRRRAARPGELRSVESERRMAAHAVGTSTVALRFADGERQPTASRRVRPREKG